MQDRQPHPGDIWRHFKGSEYTIHSIDSIIYATPKGRSIRIGNRRSAIAAHDIPAESSIVIYRAENNKLWARSIDNFFEVLPPGGNEYSTRWHRFEFVAAEGDRV